MGKHSAPRARTITPAATTPAALGGDARAAAPAPTASTTRAPAAPRGPIPAVLAQTAAFGALAIVVAVVALTWAGIGGREAALVGIGLLLVGVVGFFLIPR